MLEFLKEFYWPITCLIEFIAAATGLVLYKKYKSSAAKYFIYFLVYAFVVDLIGGYPRYFRNLDLFGLIEGTLIAENYWWYTLFWWIGLSSFMVF